MTTMTEPTKPGRGRPSTYDPALCDKIEGMGKLGLSRWQIASRLEIAPNNLRNWEGAHEDFRAALEIARLDALDYYESLDRKSVV